MFVKPFIIWDFDGTLVDSERFFKDIIYSYLQGRGYAKDLSKFSDYFYFKSMAGKPDGKMFEVMADAGIIEKNIVKPEIYDGDFFRYAEDRFKNIKLGELKLTKGMDKILDALYQKYDMCIATSAHRDDFLKKCYSVNNEIINGMRKFSATEVPDDYKYLNFDKYKTKTKPNPSVFIYAFENCKEVDYPDIFNNFTGKVVIFEDSKSGCEAGRNFKEFFKDTIVVGYIGGEHRPDGEELKKSGADYIVKDRKDVVDLFCNVVP
ncbi:MAG: HAD hydrolase-like protein [Rickettsiales bacterium]|jgi:phosphoglycolate phosphatase-like HAD superfamily hydrolase|nr:HAD hydrolase-like protein [Rickettsiales bacterium]